jgi:hypothetical protein
MEAQVSAAGDESSRPRYVYIGANVEPKMRDALGRLARRHHQSTSLTVRQILRDHLEAIGLLEREEI